LLVPPIFCAEDVRWIARKGCQVKHKEMILVHSFFYNGRTVNCVQKLSGEAFSESISS